MAMISEYDNILSNIPEQIDVVISVDRYRGQYKMKIENNDTVETITNRAMKGVDPHNRQLMYSAFISGISQQFLEWTIHLFELIHALKEESNVLKDRKKKESDEKLAIMKKRLLQARGIIESQVREMDESETHRAGY